MGDNAISEHLWNPYTAMADFAKSPLVIDHAVGSEVFDIDGRSYIDAMGGLWNVQVGYGRTEIADAIDREMRRLAYCPLNGRSHRHALNLAETLAQIAPGELSRCFFTSGGAEAVETAIKVARQYWRQSGRPAKKAIIGMQGAFHGCTLGALSACGVDEERRPYEPLLEEEFPKIPFVDPAPVSGPLNSNSAGQTSAEALEALILDIGPDAVAAFIAEPVMGLAGIHVPSRMHWAELEAVCRNYDVLLIADEVAVGFGRVGTMFACHYFGIKPDLLACSKGITSGYQPLGAMMATERIFDAFLGAGRKLVHGYTYGGHPAACVAACANIDILLSEDLSARAASMGDLLLHSLQARLDSVAVVKEVRGLGLAIGIQLEKGENGESRVGADAVCRVMLNQGVITRAIGLNDVVPLMPPLILSEAQADRIVDVCDSAIAAVGRRPLHKAGNS